MNLSSHITVVASLHNVRVWWKEDQNRPQAIPGRYFVALAPVVDETTYLTALHEIAHVVLDHRSKRAIIQTEMAAWKWALEHSRCPLTEAGVGHIRRCLGSYLIANSIKGPLHEAHVWLANLKPGRNYVVKSRKQRLP